MSWVMPDTSPAPFRTKPPPTARWSKMFSLGRMAVTPVRTGPFPRRSGPAPRMMVECPTRTPSTSVMEFHRPGRKRPSGTPSSRARNLASVLCCTSNGISDERARRHGCAATRRGSSTLRKLAPELLQAPACRSAPELGLLLLLFGRGRGGGAHAAAATLRLAPLALALLVAAD